MAGAMGGKVRGQEPVRDAKDVLVGKSKVSKYTVQKAGGDYPLLACYVIRQLQNHELHRTSTGSPLTALIYQ